MTTDAFEKFRQDMETTLAPLLARFPEGAIKTIDCGRGWWPLLLELDQKLAEINPDYVIFQVKEKFATLRYHAALGASDPSDGGARPLIVAAMEKAARTCSECGDVSDAILWNALCDPCTTRFGMPHTDE